jgi:tagatose-6-phosphate ketose/aldose isomerase
MTPLPQTATWTEIHAQPAIWADWGRALPLAALRAFVAEHGAQGVWFTGAGSSDYVGQIVAAALEGQKLFRAIPTTDIVARPHVLLAGRRPLIVSFGRSGNSAETVGTLDALDALAPDAPRLNITYNQVGALAARTQRAGDRAAAPASAQGAVAGAQTVVVLPAATHDAGFAMTSSFTTMLLTALAIFGPPVPWDALADRLQTLLPLYGQAAEGPVADRIVFVGSGALAQAARECALKVMELTAGQVPALWESSLGFRHGPKSFVRGNTRIVVLVHPDPHTRRYDDDLVAELRQQFPQARVTTLGPGGDIDSGGGWAEGPLAALLVPFAQILGAVWSDRLGLHVDDPFAGKGTLSRVVSGVRLYPVAP